MKTTMYVALLALILGGCSALQPDGPGVGCDDCAVAEAAPAAPFSNAAAAAASGGQEASQQPYNRDTARINPLTTVGRGAGPTTSSANMDETRELASGGATNISFVPSVSSSASAGGGGSVAPSVLALRETVQFYRDAAKQAQVMGDSAEAARYTTLVQDTLDKLMVASADAAKHVTINYNWQNSRNQMTGVSSSKTGRQPESPETVKALAGAAAESSKTLFTGDYADFPAPAAKKAEAPDAPPAGPAGDPNGGG